MEVKVVLYNGVYHQKFLLDTKNLARNYEDEIYAYWIVEDVYHHYHEVNILKEGGKFLLKGYDYLYQNREMFEEGLDYMFQQEITFSLA